MVTNMASRKKPAPRRYTRDLSFRDPYVGLRRSSLTSTGPIISLRTYLPRPVALAARRKIYTYPHPLQRSRRSRTIRTKLRHRKDLVPVTVRLRLPHRLPLALPSYVSLSRNRLNIHSRKQLAALEARGERNRRRYSEGKYHRRKARHGQLDSPGGLAYGSAAHAYYSGKSINQIAEAATAARAVLKGR